MIKNVLIFVGGYGKRLGHLTKKTPKPLLKFNQKPFIEFIFEVITLLHAVIFENTVIKLLTFKRFELFIEFHISKFPDKLPPFKGK